MKRANVTCFGNTYKGYILIETMDDLQKYHDSILHNRAKEAMKDVLHASKRGFIGHCTTILGNTAHALCDKGEIRWIADITGRVATDQVKYVASGLKLAINHNGGYMPLPEDAIIELISNFKYTTKDINVTQFEGGRHWYATVGGLDVIDEFFGRQFNTYDYAYKQAVKFMEKLNKSAQ